MSSKLLTRRPEVDDGPEPMDPRLRARRVEVARLERRGRRRGIVALAMATALVLTGLVIARSRVFDVDVITVTGARRAGPDTVRAAAAIAPGRAMTSVDLDAAEARVEALPWVAAATVTRRWPGTLSIGVRERVPVAVSGEGAGAAVVDGDGIVLGAATSADRLPVAGPGAVVGPGDRLPAAQRRIVRVLAELPADLRAEVAEGTVGANGLGLVLRDGIVVDLGDPTRIGAKADRITVLLAKADRATMATLDVTVVDAPAVTRRPTPEERSAASGPSLTIDEPGGA